MGWGRWTVFQEMLLERVGLAPSIRHEGVTGRMLKVKAVAGGYFASKSDFPDPRFVASSGVKFRINTFGVSKQQPLVFEFQSFAKERKAKLSRLSGNKALDDLVLNLYRMVGNIGVPSGGSWITNSIGLTRSRRLSRLFPRQLARRCSEGKT